ncbi:HAMP domain-containing histidine kinase [Fortiea sp. LEGE XX443]|uniref:sensor histidine kinase n=1 Tax=Fortiea sp. LEGE XX443 TaxID=1828611 RepID=UPI0018802A16|nr:ATP-binding protein [Fortiea sp. LEGE XX443]MBE9006517.1 HAMP domain-containing histidine kinase [Fortiea sp. LEGE XX443]
MKTSLFRKLKLVPSQLVTVTVLLTFLLFIPQIWLNLQAYYDFHKITKNEFRLQKLSDKIIYFDEVLTMSARMNAATGNLMWEQRYRKFESQLDIAIQESIKLAPKEYRNEDAKKIDIANQELIKMESQSFDLVKKNQKQAAQLLLSSREYEIQKQIYADGVAKRNYNISFQLQQQVTEYQQRIFWAILGSIVSLMLLIPAWFLVLNLLQEYLKAKKNAQVALEETNYMLENQVTMRTEILNQKNIQLQQTLQELQHTQVQLIQTEKMSSLGQLVAGIAHEINNPVNFVYGNLMHVREYTQQLLSLINLYQQQYSNYNSEITILMSEMDLDFILDDLPKLLSSMAVGTERIREIVLILRNFSRLDEADMKSVDIHEGINSTLLILQHRLKEKDEQQEITIIKKYGDLPLVECYPGGLNQVFMNIISNAIDALREQEIDYLKQEIKQYHNYITIHTQFQNKDRVIISVKDNGSGINEEIKPRLFDPFFTTKPVGQGTGLGLSISYQIIVEKHKGKINCISAPGKGTEFLIEIPVKQINEARLDSKCSEYL